MISKGKFERSLDFIRRSGVADDIEKMLRPNGKGGRPRLLSVEVLLTALLETQNRVKNTMLSEVHITLTKNLTVSHQRQLGFIGADGINKLTRHKVYYLVDAISKKYAHTHTDPSLDEEERTRRAAEYQDLLDNLLAATVPAGYARQGRYAVDATAIDSAARPGQRFTKKATQSDAQRTGSFDTDARWGYRTKTVDNKSKKVFGYQAIAFTRMGAVNQTTPEPFVTDRIVVIPANGDQTAATIDAVDRLSTPNAKVIELAVDRGFSYAQPDKWAYQLLQRKIDQVIDLHKNDHGVRDHEGLPIIAGIPYCPTLPEELRDIRRPVTLAPPTLPKNPSHEEQADHDRLEREQHEFHDAIAEREKYAFARISKGRAFTPEGKGGNQRFSCPAQVAKVKCGNCPFSMGLPDEVPAIENPPNKDTGEAPEACSNRTITLPVTVQPKLRQAEVWGSPEWVKSYARRTRVEGTFGLLKSTKVGGVRRGWTQLVGIIKTSLMTAIAFAVNNISQSRRWAKLVAHTADPLLLDNIPEVHFVEFPVGVHPIPALSPPGN